MKIGYVQGLSRNNFRLLLLQLRQGHTVYIRMSLSEVIPRGTLSAQGA
jgi:hypothetical protein